MTQINPSEMDQELINGHKTFNEIIRSIAIKEDILCIDLEKELGTFNEIKADRIHLNKNGSQKAAAIIYSKLKSKF